MGAVITGRFGVMSCCRMMLCVGLGMAVVSCASSENFAPVTDISAYEAVIRAGSVHQYPQHRADMTARHVPVHVQAVTQWTWPAHGKLLADYTSANKGIDIGGRVGDPIYAAAAGLVVYAGDGLRGYGNLVIIKHDNVYLSASAYNSRLLVRKGEWVKKGQKIAEMGQNASGQPMLHFEIRRSSIPVNPLNVL